MVLQNDHMKIGIISKLLSHRHSVLLLILVSLTILTSHSICSGQDESEGPKLGLVLSGGGACGIAHIGVLMVMDEEGLRPDYITGVSMGSLIGALYSAGYSADSLAKLCSRIDWNMITSNRIPENKIIYGEKDHFYNSIITLPISRSKVKLPSGLINGQQVENTLSYYLWPVAEINDFSKLPIPFMCLAVDLIKCTKVELRSGYLPDAVRASCGVPYIFTPLKIDSLLLVDGGVLRNFAAIEAKQMGADILIGSYTGSRYRNENELQSVTEVMIQLGFFSSINDFKQQKKMVDYLIEPETDDISPTSFLSYDTLIMRGYRAAEKYRMIFRKLADSLNTTDKKAVSLIDNRKNFVFDSIVVRGNKFFSGEQIKGVLGISPGEPVSRERLTEMIDLLYGKSWFEKVKYRIIPSGGSLTLEIDCIEKPRAMLYGSVHYDNAVNAGLIIGLSVRDPFVRSSQLDLNSFVGASPRFNFNFIKFIDRNQKYSLSADLLYDDTFVPKMELGGATEDTKSRNLSYGITLGRRLGLNNMLRLSGLLENRNLVRDQIEEQGKEKFKFLYTSAEFGYHFNSLNTKFFADKGIKSDLTISASYLLSAKYSTDTTIVLYDNKNDLKGPAEMFYTLKGSFNKYFTKYRKWTLCAGADILLISKTDSVSEMNNMYFVGGIESVSSRSIAAVGFHPLEIQTNKMAGIHFDIDYEIVEKVHLTLMTAATAIIEQDGKNSLSLLPGIGLSAGYLSIIGPIKAGIMYGYYKNEEYFKRLKGFISVGYNF